MTSAFTSPLNVWIWISHILALAILIGVPALVFWLHRHQKKWLKPLSIATLGTWVALIFHYIWIGQPVHRWATRQRWGDFNDDDIGGGILVFGFGWALGLISSVVVAAGIRAYRRLKQTGRFGGR